MKILTGLVVGLSLFSGGCSASDYVPPYCQELDALPFVGNALADQKLAKADHETRMFFNLQAGELARTTQAYKMAATESEKEAAASAWNQACAALIPMIKHIQSIE